jgi:uncharacterized protein YlxW (UPF0749 family)
VRTTVVWRGLALAVLLVIGVVVVASAQLAGGTDLRSERRTDLVDLIRAEQERVRDETGRVAELQREVVAAVRARTVTPTAGELEALVVETSGAGVVVELDDAPVPAADVPPGFTADDYVVHEQDLHAVMNALWAGGAQAMAVMDQRVLATSAVRCVGSTVLVHGQVYTPPYQVTAIGPPERMVRALDASPRFDLYRQYVDLLGLGLEVSTEETVTVPAYQGPLSVSYAQVVG